MRLELRRLVLVKRYLWGSLVVAIVPLVVLAILYDRYSSNLLANLLTEKVDGEVEATAVKMISFMNTQAKRLDNLADLPEVSEAFALNPSQAIPTKLKDLIYLEIGDPDIYGVELFDKNGKCIRAIPKSFSAVVNKNYASQSIVRMGNLEIIGPVLPNNHRPGWFLMRKPVTRNGKQIGALAFKIRLSSLTELAAPLSRKNVYEPRITVASTAVLSVVGTETKLGVPLTTSRQIIPGWYITLVRSGSNIADPRDSIRYLLLILAILSGVGVVYLFVHMSERLARIINPLAEGAKAIAKGDFSVKVSEKAPGELKILAQSFNEMSTRLSTMISSRVDSERRAALGNFAAGIAHEIRNPLTTIRTSIHGLKRLDVDDSRQNIFQVMIDEIVRVDAIVTEFLEYARPREPKREPTAVRDVFKSIEALTSGTLHDANIKLVMAGDSSLLLYVDPAQLRQILMNVVLNSIQAMPEGGFLTLRSHKKGKFCEILIKDTGVGISEENLDKVLAPFFTTKGKGTGLGLSICNQLIKANGGEMEIESKKDIGTSICIRVPMVGKGAEDV